MEERRALRRQRADHHFGSLIMPALNCRCLPAGHLGGDKGAFRVYPTVSNPLSGGWQRHVLASSSYLELGMLDDAALALEEIEPEDRTRTEVLGAHVVLYIATRKWDMAAAVASHLVKAEPEDEGWWINPPILSGGARVLRRRRPSC